MGILDNLEAYLELGPDKVKCTKCEKPFISSTDKPFVCLMCSQ